MSHICIIEDDAAIAEIERDYLEINGFTVSIATDGVSGLNLTQKESFDLILLDLMLPQLDGFTLCRKLREIFTLQMIIWVSEAPSRNSPAILKPSRPCALWSRSIAVPPPRSSRCFHSM